MTRDAIAICTMGWHIRAYFLCQSYTESILAPQVRMTPRVSHVASLTERASALERAE
jgi:hypothetical protein